MGRKKGSIYRKLFSYLTILIFSISISSNELNVYIDSNQKTFEDIALKIWNYAELGYLENKSSQALSSELENNGFKITNGVAGIPTSFIAEYNNGGPIIGILGEYDALPGLAQTASPFKEVALNETNGGHACGHHLFGAASAWAAVVIKEWIVKNNIKGTIRFYGTPAEEGGSGKVYLVREGLFDDVDIVMHLSLIHI